MRGDPDGRYELPDPELTAYDHGVGALSADGEVKGHLACLLSRMVGGAPWPWFVIVWVDGSRERRFEDYGPGWHTVRELDAGYLEHEPMVWVDRRFLGVIRYRRGTPGRPRTYDFARLPEDDAARMWGELALTDDDF